MLIPKYPDFTGTVEPNPKGGYDIVGKYELISKTKLKITEVPYFYDREEYLTVLEALKDNDTIIGYSDDCDIDGFQFLVTLPRNFSADIDKTFKLRSKVTENLSVIGPDNKLKEYDSP